MPKTQTLPIDFILNNPPRVTYQAQVYQWLTTCFGKEIADSKSERNQRFLEESLELVQSCDMTVEQAHKLVDYVYGRPVGKSSQEVGGTVVTLAALCEVQGIDMTKEGEVELARIWTKIKEIQAKQKAKPKF